MTTYYTYDSTAKRLVRAPDPATINGEMVVHPTAAMYATIGAYPRGESAAPTPPEGKIVVQDGYELVNGEWRPHWVFDDAPPPPPRTFSKLKLYAALAQAGLWDALVAWLQSQTYEGINAYTAFTLAQDLTDDHPLFSQWLAAAKTALSVSDEQAEAILAASIL